MDSDKLADTYDAYYYAHGCGVPYGRIDAWLNHFKNITDHIIGKLQPQTLLDAGCAMGLLVEEMRRRGVEAFGIDISEYAISQVHPDVKPYCWVGSVAEPFPQSYDVIVCIEVLEHMPREDAERAIANFCRHAKSVLFSSTPFDYREPTHFNVQPIEAWAALFAQHGFYRDVDFDASFISPWAIRFVPKQEPTQRLIRDYERRFWELWKENVDLRSLSVEMRNELSNTEGQRIQIQSLETQVQLLNTQLTQQQHLVSLLQAQLVEKEATQQQLEQTLQALHTTIEQKNAHITELEQLLRQIENGRVLKTLQGLKNTTEIVRNNGLLAAARQTLTVLRTPHQPSIPALPQLTPPTAYAAWLATHEPSSGELLRQSQESAAFAYRPLLSVILTLDLPTVSTLQMAIESLRAQTYGHWELCIVAHTAESAQTKALLEAYQKHENRIRVQFVEQHQAANLNSALNMATGDFVLTLDQADQFAPDALYEIVKLLNRQGNVDVVNFDQDTLSKDGKTRHSPWFKPQQWSPELLLSANLLAHAAIRRSLLEQVGGFDVQMAEAQTWDAAFRVTERTSNVAHVPRVLYHQRQRQPQATLAAQQRALTAHLARHQGSITAHQSGQIRVHWPFSGTKVSILIATKDEAETLRTCLNAILTRTHYAKYEILVIDMGSSAPSTAQYYDELANEPRVRIISYNEPFSYTQANNYGATQAQGSVLIFLRPNIEVLETDWLVELASWSERPEIGIVGGKILGPDYTIEHAGIVLGLNNGLFHGAAEGESGPFGSTEWYRDCIGVSGACITMRRDAFEQLGGFDPNYQRAFYDTDIGLRTVAAGLRVVYTPFARLRQFDRRADTHPASLTDLLRATMRIAPQAQTGDPFFSPNLSLDDTRPTIARNREQSIHMSSVLAKVGLVEPLLIGTPLEQSWSNIPQHPPTGDGKSIAIVSCDLNPTTTSQLLFDLACSLVKQGYTITVFSPIDGPLLVRYAQANIRVVVEPTLLNDARTAFTLLRDYNAALVNTIAGWRATYAAKAAGITCIWWLHEPLPSQHQQLAEALEVADALLFPSQAVAAHYRHLVAAEKCHIVHISLEQALPPSTPSPFAKQSDVLKLTNVAPIEPRQGQDMVIQAIAALPVVVREQLHVYIVGPIQDWQFYTELQRLAQSLTNVFIINENLLERMQAYLAHADLVVDVSHDAAQSIAVSEAMRYEKAIIVSKDSSSAEMIEHDHNGVIIERTAEALAQAIQQLHGQPERIRALGANANTTFQQSLAPQIVGEQLGKLFAGLMNDKRSMSER